VTLTSTFVAQGVEPVSGVLLQYGVLGVAALVLGFVVRVLYSRVDEDRAYHRNRADRLEEELRSLNALVRGEYVATIAKANEAIADFSAISKDRGRQP
jgi:hypothetical protein